MIKKLLFFWVLLLFCCLNYGFGATGPIVEPGSFTGCARLTTPGTYTLAGGNIINPSESPCISIESSNVTLQLSGLTIDGSSSQIAISISDNKDNVSIYGGNSIIKNWNYGVYWPSWSNNELSVLVSDVIFQNSSTDDVYMSNQMNYKKQTLELDSCVIGSSIYINMLKEFKMTDLTVNMDLASSRFLVRNVNNLSLDFATAPVVGILDMRLIANYTNYNTDNAFYIKDVCTSVITDVDTESFLLKLYDSYNATGTCFSISGHNNVVFDLDGHYLSGDNGGADYAVSIGAGMANLTVKNGIIKNWGQGISCYLSSEDVFTYYIDNISFYNNTYDFYHQNSAAKKNQSYYIEDSYFSGGISILYLDDLNIQNSVVNASENTDQFYISYTNNVLFNFSSEPVVGKMYLHTIGDYDNVDTSNTFNVKDVCGSTFKTIPFDIFYVRFFEDVDALSTCLNPTDVNNLTFDLNGHYLSGDDGVNDYAVSLSTAMANFTIKNGIVKNWGNGFRNYLNLGDVLTYYIDNISFYNNTYDFYHQNSAAKKNQSYYIEDSYFSDGIYVMYLDDLNIQNSVINISDDTEEFRITYTNSILLNLSSEPVVNKLYLHTIGAYENIDSSNTFNVKDVCGSTLTGVPSDNFYINFLDDIDTTSTCLNPINVNNLTFDLNGHYLSGDGGTSDIAISIAAGVPNLTVKNGVIRDWGYGLKYALNYLEEFTYYIDNISFYNNTYDFYHQNTGSKKSQSYYIEDSYFSDGIYVIYLDDLNIQNSVINITEETDSFHFTYTNSLLFNFSSEPVVNKLYLHTIGAYENADSSNTFNVKDVCGSTLTGVPSDNFYINFLDDIDTISTCLNPTNVNNLTFDLNGHYLSGDDGTSDNAVSIAAGVPNLTVKNGVIRNWGYGLRYALNYLEDFTYYIDNISFYNNTYDFYHQNTGNRKNQSYYIEDSYFSGYFYVNYLDDLNIQNSVINISDDTEEFHFTYTNSLLFNFSSEPVVNKLYLHTISDYESVGSSNIFNVKDVCGSVLTSVSSSNIYVKFLEDVDTTSTCLNPTNVNNLTFDLDGHYLSGDGGISDYAVSIATGMANLTVKNGIIKNWGQGVYYYSSGLELVNYYVDNMSFENNSYDINLYNTVYRKTQIPVVSNSIFDGVVQFIGMDNIIFYGNNISSADNISFSYNNNFTTHYLVDSDYVGNLWGDFTCTDSTNNYSVSDLNWEYIICDENDYSVNGISDISPLLYFGMSVQSLVLSSLVLPEGTVNQDWIFINLTSDSEIASCSLNWNGTLDDTMTVSGNSCWINKSGSYGSTYLYNITVMGVNTAVNVTDTKIVTMQEGSEEESEAEEVGFFSSIFPNSSFGSLFFGSLSLFVYLFFG